MVALRAAPSAEMQRERRVASGHVHPLARFDAGQCSLDQQVAAIVEAQIFQVNRGLMIRSRRRHYGR